MVLLNLFLPLKKKVILTSTDAKDIWNQLHLLVVTSQINQQKYSIKYFQITVGIKKLALL